MDEELIEKLNNRNIPYLYYQDVDEYLDLLEENYPFNGSKINWDKTMNHKTFTIDNFEDIKNIFKTEFNTLMSEDNESNFYYIGDNITEYVYEISIINILNLIEIVFEEIPQHHYFLSKNNDKCICISMENYLDYGEKKV